MATPTLPTQIAIPDIIMCLVQRRIASIAGIEQLMHPPRIPINHPFRPFTPSSSSVLFAHRPSLRYWLATTTDNTSSTAREHPSAHSTPYETHITRTVPV